MNNIKNRILCLADSINTASWESDWCTQKAISDWFKYHDKHGFDSDDLNCLEITPDSSDAEIKDAIIKQWKAEAEELRELREFQIKNDLGLV